VITIVILYPTISYASSNNTWDSKTNLKGDVVIPAGKTITVAPNTKINVAPGTKITILGNLNAPSGLTLTGNSWTGLHVKGKANLKNFTLTGATTPFYVDTTGTFTINGGKISNVAGPSVVAGKFVTNSLNYEKPAGNGINTNGKTGTITIDKSKFTSSAKNNGDFFGLTGVKSFSLTNSSITGSHCAFHVQEMESMKLDNITITGNVYAAMLYGSSMSGAKTINKAVIKNNEFGIDEGSAKNRNGNILITNSTISGNGKDLQLYTTAIKVKK